MIAAAERARAEAREVGKEIRKHLFISDNQFIRPASAGLSWEANDIIAAALLAAERRGAEARGDKWAVLYLHNWDGKVYPEIHCVCGTEKEAMETARATGSPDKYWVRRARALAPELLAASGLVEERDKIEATAAELSIALFDAKERVAELEAALRTYGWHLPGCPAHRQQEPCNCGWERALATLAKEPGR